MKLPIVSTLFVLLAGLALVAGCGAPDDSASRAAAFAAAPALAAAPAFACPDNCTDGALCRLADGSCVTTCNACFCARRGGTIDNQCVAAAPAAPASPESTASIIIGGGGTCGKNVCGPGTYCCNAGCGICARKGDLCTDRVCEPDSATAPAAP